MRTALVTGVVGFIGMHVASRLLDAGWSVVGVDNLNAYYDVKLKLARLSCLTGRDGFQFDEGNVADANFCMKEIGKRRFDVVIHLAAQAGVRYSIDFPESYIASNLVGFGNILELVRAQKPRHFLYASSSSVYGGNTKFPFAEADRVDFPLSLYAATKKANELMAHTYSHLYNVPSTGMRFFTVYGPWGRPDMAVYKFVQAAFEGKTIEVFNEGNLHRDFTYVDDVVDAIEGLIDIPPASFVPRSGEQLTGSAHGPYRIVNVGNGEPIRLMDFIQEVEFATGLKLKKSMLPMQAGDVEFTHADTELIQATLGRQRARTPLRQGLAEFVKWYKSYHEL